MTGPERKTWRFMKEVEPGHWVIKCRACGNRSKRDFDAALDCHEYWRDHAKTPEHARNIDPNYFSAHDADRHRVRQILQSIAVPPATSFREWYQAWLSERR